VCSSFGSPAIIRQRRELAPAIDRRHGASRRPVQLSLLPRPPSDRDDRDHFPFDHANVDTSTDLR
jgi:hypothetical protein